MGVTTALLATVAALYTIRWILGHLASVAHSCHTRMLPLPPIVTQPDPALASQNQNTSGKRVKLVVGGCGFLGRAIVSELVARGDCIVKVIDLVTGSQPGVTYIKCNISDPSALEPHFVGVDDVIHTASLIGMVNYSRLYNANTLGTAHIINACVKAGVKTLVYTSSMSVVVNGEDIVNGDESIPVPKNHISPYGSTKALAERLVLDANGRGGLRTCALRPPGMYGAGDRTMVDVIMMGRPLMGSQNRMDFLYVASAAHAHVLASDKLGKDKSVCAGKVYHISDDEPVVYVDFVKKILHEYDPSMKVSHAPRFFWLALASVFEFVYWLGGGFFTGPFFDLTRGVLPYAMSTYYFSIDNAKRDLCFKPLYTVDEAIKKSVAMLKENRKTK